MQPWTKIDDRAVGLETIATHTGNGDRTSGGNRFSPAMSRLFGAARTGAQLVQPMLDGAGHRISTGLLPLVRQDVGPPSAARSKGTLSTVPQRGPNPFGNRSARPLRRRSECGDTSIQVPTADTHRIRIGRTFGECLGGSAVVRTARSGGSRTDSLVPALDKGVFSFPTVG